MIGSEVGSGTVAAEPPPGVTGEVLWRLAARLYQDHRDDDRDATRCRTCRQRWPCSGRRLAELGLRRATQRV